MHDKVLEAWRPAVPSVIISYDHPDQRVPIRQQIDRALDLPLRNSSMLREILLKPESSGQTLLRLPTVLENVRHLAQFDIIGVTEKEVGNSIFDRMKNIAQIRLALDSVGLCTPLHVFGSLDTVTTPMYFMAGADIFDGLTWLRFAYYKGQTVYKHNYGALKYGVRTKAHMIDARCWNDNYYYLKDLELEMRRYLNDHDTGVFRYHSDLFRTALEGRQRGDGGFKWEVAGVEACLYIGRQQSFGPWCARRKLEPAMSRLGANVAKQLGDLLRAYNERDTEAVKAHLEELRGGAERRDAGII